ncbi:MAG: oxygenase MpaB family protein [Leadbetterella sp.]
MNKTVQQIWGNSDNVLFIFAACSAEFALNPDVDWLFFTGKLPKDPLGRMSSTVTYARMILKSTEEDAIRAIDQIAAIHAGVENKRGFQIPARAYRDVLYMLIDYSIKSEELLNKKLALFQKREVFEAFYKIGAKMHIPDLPTTYSEWLIDRNRQLRVDLEYSEFSPQLMESYKNQLGWLRYKILLAAQSKMVTKAIVSKLRITSFTGFDGILFTYKKLKAIGVDAFLKKAMVPNQYHSAIFS